MAADQLSGDAKGRSDLIVGVTIAFLTVAWIAVSMRTYVRLIMIRNFGWDDAVMLLAAVSHFHQFKTIMALTNAHRSPSLCTALSTSSWSPMALATLVCL